MSREQKRGSSSFSKSTNPLTVEKTNSFSADKINSLRTQQRGAEKLLVEKVVEGLNGSNGPQWRLNSFEEKRNIAGFKARVEWVWPEQEVRVTLKISFTSIYFRISNHIAEDDIFVQIEQLGVALSMREKRELQERLERLLANSVEVVRVRAYSDEAKKQSECLRKFLLDAGAQLQSRSYEGLRRCQERVGRLSKKYMLYPAPASFAWNPLGTICITENKYPTHRKAFMGEPNSLRKYFQSTRHDAAFSLREEEGTLDLGDTSHEVIYDWQVEEDIDLLIFSRERALRQERYHSIRTNTEGKGPAKREEKQAEGEGVLLANLSPLPNNKLRRIYERYFGGSDRTSQFHRHDKLRVYDVRSFNRDYEDDIVFLFQRLTTERGLQGLFQNELSAYPGLLDDMRPFHYKLVGGMLQQALANPKLRFYSFLKLFVLENQFLAEQLQRYFKQLYRLLGRIPHQQLYSIGSYSHFDSNKAELILLDLIHLTLDPPDRPSLTKTVGDGVVVKVRSRVGLPRFNVQSLVGENEKNGFLTGLFPILIVKDREMQKFEFKQVKRIITANSKLFLFLRRMNELIGKAEQSRNKAQSKAAFLRSLLDNYRRYTLHHQSHQLAIQPRRIFYLHCRHCLHPNRLYDLSAREDLQFCGKCKQKLVADTS